MKNSVTFWAILLTLLLSFSVIASDDMSGESSEPSDYMIEGDDVVIQPTPMEEEESDDVEVDE